MSDIQRKWDAKYLGQTTRPIAAEVLIQNQHLLPKTGIALDLACGRGGNALLLANLGLQVTARDISPVAIQQLQQFSRAVNAQVCDVVSQTPEEEQYDVVVVSYFLDRALAASIVNALKPGGLLFYQTWCQQKTADRGPSNPEYLLADNELLKMFSGLRPRFYREEALLGDVSRGQRDIAMLVAERVG